MVQSNLWIDFNKTKHKVINGPAGISPQTGSNPQTYLVVVK